ncbi:MAG: ABC transporter ATP-binding protein [Lachnospiraceae bacterium]|nr:ABC transporter ATP-binding protein [Lachnospiraceae bacterium]
MQYYIRKSWKINVVAVILIVLSAALQVSASIFNMRVVDAAVAKDIHGIVVATIRLICLWIVIMFVIYSRNIVRAKAMKIMHNQIRSDLTKGISRLSPQQFRNNKAGSYLSWYTNDIQQLDTSCFVVFYNLIAQTAVVIATVAILIYLNITLTFVCIAGSIVLLFLPKLFEKKANQAGEELSFAQEDYVKQLKSHLDGFYILKIFDRIPYFTHLMEKSSEAVERKKYQYIKFSGKMEVIFNLLSTIFQLGIFFITALFALWQWVPFGAIVSIGNLAGHLSGALETITNASVSFAMGTPIWKKFDEAKTSDGQTEGTKNLVFTNDIIFQDVGFSYGDKQILEHTDLLFQKGGKYALIGPSGCGKTTVLKLLMRYLDEHTGRILIDGEEIQNYTLSSLYQQISYIDQEVYLFDTTIRQNITLGDSFSDGQLATVIRDSALEHDLEKMPEGLDTQVGENGNRLSGGQKQRIAIARALLHGQKILLMDEGTSALDKKNAFKVEEKLLSNPNVTVILVSHHLDDHFIDKFNRIYHPGHSEE